MIGISLLIGGYSVPLLIANAEEKTILLGISYVWMTMPITLGSALFVVHAPGFALLAPSGARSRCRPSSCSARALLVLHARAPVLGAHPPLLYSCSASLSSR